MVPIPTDSKGCATCALHNSCQSEFKKTFRICGLLQPYCHVCSLIMKQTQIYVVTFGAKMIFECEKGHSMQIAYVPTKAMPNQGVQKDELKSGIK